MPAWACNLACGHTWYMGWPAGLWTLRLGLGLGISSTRLVRQLLASSAYRARMCSALTFILLGLGLTHSPQYTMKDWCRKREAADANAPDA